MIGINELNRDIGSRGHGTFELRIKWTAGLADTGLIIQHITRVETVNMQAAQGPVPGISVSQPPVQYWEAWDVVNGAVHMRDPMNPQNLGANLTASVGAADDTFGDLVPKPVGQSGNTQINASVYWLPSTHVGYQGTLATLVTSLQQGGVPARDGPPGIDAGPDRRARPPNRDDAERDLRVLGEAGWPLEKVRSPRQWTGARSESAARRSSAGDGGGASSGSLIGRKPLNRATSGASAAPTR